MKRIFLCLMAVLMAVTLSLPAVRAADDSSGLMGNLRWNLTSDGTLTVTGTGDMIDACPWPRDQVRRIVIGQGVSSLSDAMQNHGNLLSLEIPQSLAAVSPQAFTGCSALKELTVPASLTANLNFKSAGCHVTALHLTAGTGKISNMVRGLTFQFGNDLTELTLAEGITDTRVLMPNGSFTTLRPLPRVTQLVLPSSMVHIGARSIRGWIGLTELRIPAKVEFIGICAFQGCTGVTRIDFLGSAPEIQPGAFDGITAEVHYPLNDPSWPQEARQDYGGHLTWIGQEPVEPEPEPLPSVEFTDVSPADYYYEAVQWAAARGITSGTTPTTFSPNAPCTRAQAVSFLWRAAGMPGHSGNSAPFTDVGEDAWYRDAVLWAVENGIAAGLSPDTFGPSLPCTRAQILSFQWRKAGCPAPAGSGGFADVRPGDYFHTAVAWAVENGIAAGLSPSTFGPGSTCTRGQIVCFLYRQLG